MADENDIASGYEQGERDRALQHHARKMAAITPADDCEHCGVELQAHRKPWGCCIECATVIEQRAKGFAR